MARSSSGVWGIEIGQTALKALRCSLVDGEPVADAFDFIEYPKILSQPEAVAEELIADALEQLLERNDAITEKVCISVPGQSGLAKFFKPPPVEVKKIADIVRYEARQQIPFDLADVVWDFQMMPGSMVEEGYALESEVGLFAMKREQAYRQMTPFDEANIEVDQVQLAPLALYNMLAFDRMHERVDAGVFDSDDPPPSTVLLSIGTDSSDLIVTNGFRIWQRSMPIGGNHFTRQLTKDLKMTFAKAEHLKRNAREAVDPKLIFQTMRPVFNDLVTEVQRSIGFFRSIDKKADIKELIVTGNTVKMPGLAAYLGKNLGFDVHVLDRFNRLGGDDVLSIPTFRDNIPTFAVCYGLCLQGLGVSQIHASLVPREILTQRMIRAKKPWTLAGLAALMVGMSAHYVLTEKSWATTHDDLWKAPQAEVTRMKTYSDEHLSDDANLNSKLTYLNDIGKEVSGNSEARLKWLEIIKVVNDAIPRPDFPDGKVLGPKELPYLDRKDFHVQQFETKYYEDLSLWYTEKVARRYRDEYRSWARITGNPVPEDLNEDLGPTGPGWVIQLNCYHYYNSPDRIGFEGSNHVRNLMTTSFMKSSVELPIGTDANGKRIMETFTLPEMGLTYPLLLDDNKDKLVSIANPDYDADAIMAEQMKLVASGAAPSPDAAVEAPMLQVRKLEFIYQIVWQEKILSERLEAKEAARLLAEEEAAATAAAEESAVVEE
ncbi:type IV pilus assembly protein PilM [Rubripirellula reticaptiva]|uniref:Competence protein A n=1 Tax=Rubripirellula reticaptiva TaxID=2528013 RepID=A0A5C6EP37_9BACT|nr:type IV pilus assembly protein PilM [Rubripirellula reticaptiva]TWU49391.1 Competence protein A [Rubripirellula reticaptiva]